MGKDIKDFGRRIQSKVLRILGAEKNKFRLRKKRLMEFGLRPYLLPRKVKHIYGPAKISYSVDELLVISVVRNGELYVKSFLRSLSLHGCEAFCFSR